MTDQQIRQILDKLKEQDENFASYKIEQDKLSEERLAASYKVYKELQNSNLDFHKQIGEINTKIDPIVDLANSVRGFDKIAVWIMKGLLMFAALIGAGSTILYFLRKLIIGNND